MNCHCRCFAVGLAVMVARSVLAQEPPVAESLPPPAKAPVQAAPEGESPDHKTLRVEMEKDSQAAKKLREASVTALAALSKTALALDKIRTELVGAQNLAQTMQLALTDMELEEFHQALERLANALARQDPAPTALLAEFAVCRKNVQAFADAAFLSEEQILQRLKKDHPQTAKDIEESSDPVFRSMMLAFLLSKWLPEKAEQAFASSLKLQEDVSRIAQESNRKVLRLEDKIFFTSVKVERESQSDPPPPNQQAQPAKAER